MEVLNQTSLRLHSLNISSCFGGGSSLFGNITIRRELLSSQYWIQSINEIRLADIGCPDPNCLYCSGEVPSEGSSVCHSCNSSVSDMVLRSPWECAAACDSDQDYLLKRLTVSSFPIASDTLTDLT